MRSKNFYGANVPLWCRSIEGPYHDGTFRLYLARSARGLDLLQLTTLLLSAIERVRSSLNTAQRILIGYMLISLVGTAALSGIGAVCSDAGRIDHLFTAVSAVTTTGLTTVPIGRCYSLTGQIVILVLMQIGGLGYMTLAAVLVGRVNHRLHLRRDNGGDHIDKSDGEARTDFALPRNTDFRSFAKIACIVGVGTELAGAIVLFFAFRTAEVEQPFWNAVFHSVSAFCTSGLSLFSNSFEGFAGEPSVLISLSAMSFIGAVGFLVVWDFGRSVRRWKFDLGYTNRVVLLVFVPLLIGTTVLLWFADARLDPYTGSERWLNAFFAAMTSTTTVGFSALPTSDLGGAAFVLVVATMVIGAAPSGTSGGIKTTTTAILAATMTSSLRQNEQTMLFGRNVSSEKIRASSTTLTFYLILMLVATVILAMIETGHELDAIFFEVVSAMGTIGLSFGLSANLSLPGQLIIVGLMIAGRVGILAFGAALLSGGGDEKQLKQAEQV